MTPTNTFVRKHKAGLQFKYVRKSVNSLFHRDVRPTDIDELEAIQERYTRFIETPVTKLSD